jgi:hypothetical protein
MITSLAVIIARDVIDLAMIALSMFDLIVPFQVKMSGVFWEIK